MDTSFLLRDCHVPLESVGPPEIEDLKAHGLETVDLGLGSQVLFFLDIGISPTTCLIAYQ
jgi:hypothetical protein